MTDKAPDQKNDQQKTQADKAEQRNAQNDQGTKKQEADRREAEALSEDLAPVNPVEDTGLRADYDPTGQIQQPGQPLHSTDPEKQAAFEMERREAIRRSQLGERLPDEELENEEERVRRERKNS